jgi:hypothetical protein
LAASLSACSGGDSAGSQLPDLRLPTAGGAPGPSLATCPTDKCLTVLVAPWCGVCHSVAPQIVLLRRWLDGAGISSRVVVGLSDDDASIRDFAREFGPDALLDRAGGMKARGVPLFLVSDRQGRIVKSVPGYPRGAESVEDLAAYLDLM